MHSIGCERASMCNDAFIHGECMLAGTFGSVATLELRRSLAIASAKLDRHRAEQAENEAVQQNSPSSQRTSAHLAFADHTDRLVACDRTPSSPKRSEMLTRVDSSLDCAVVLFQDVIQVRHWPLPTVFV